MLANHKIIASQWPESMRSVSSLRKHVDIHVSEYSGFGDGEMMGKIKWGKNQNP